MSVSALRMVERSSWTLVCVSLILLAGYSYWAFAIDSSWSSALSAAGGQLPETSPGFHDDEPGRSLTLLKEAGLTATYMGFQAIDIPFALLNALFLWSVLALAAKRFTRPASALRLFVFLPCLYLLAELIENPLLALLASGKTGDAAGLILAQQAATSLKWAAMAPASVIGLVLLLVMLVASLFGAFAGRKA